MDVTQDDIKQLIEYFSRNIYRAKYSDEMVSYSFYCVKMWAKPFRVNLKSTWLSVSFKCRYKRSNFSVSNNSYFGITVVGSTLTFNLKAKFKRLCKVRCLIFVGVGHHISCFEILHSCFKHLSNMLKWCSVSYGLTDIIVKILKLYLIFGNWLLKKGNILFTVVKYL